MNENILWLITARSGSKSIINKNIKELCGIHLIGYKIKTALTISDIKDVWISTDSEEYAQIARKYGAYVPFLRPAFLATDNASSADVILHAMNYAESQGKNYEFIGLLEPTSPFVYFDDIENAFNILHSTKEADAIVAVRETRPNTFFIQVESPYLDDISARIQTVKNCGRQNFKREITPSGGFYISKWNKFLENKSFYTDKTLSYIVPEESALEIDEPIDWKWAEFIINEKLIDINKLWK